MHDGLFYSMFQQTKRLFKEPHGDIPSKHDVVGWNSFQQTRPLYVKPFVPAAPPPEALWPRKIYVATRNMGVYYTDNFEDPLIQPTWIRVNDGLAELDCWEFHLDPFEPDRIQYVLTEDDKTLYRRTDGGLWHVISNNAIREALGCWPSTTSMGSFWCDPTIQGRIWLTASDTPHGVTWEELWDNAQWAFHSDNYGDTWYPHLIIRRVYAHTGAIRAIGNRVWTCDDSGVGVATHMIWSENLGSAWGRQTVDLTGDAVVELNPLCDYAYFGTPVWSRWLGMFQTVLNYRVLNFSVYPGRPGGMWFDPDVLGHQRILMNTSRLHVTNDEWATSTNAGIIERVGHEPGETAMADIMSPWAGATERMFLYSTGYHIICALYGETSLDAYGIAGNNTMSAPYTNSIPYYPVSGGVCWCGIQPVRENFTYV